MAAPNKMQWFINGYNNNTLPHVIENGRRNIGVVCMPTGTGKSGVVYDHAIYKVIQAINNNEKLIINICCPILKLCQQFINDFLSVIYGVSNKHVNKIVCFLNSSDKRSKYEKSDEPNNGISIFEGISLRNRDNSTKSNVHRFFLDDPTKNVMIIASCIKSLHKYKRFVERLKESTTYNSIKHISYIDECHLFYTREINDNHDKIKDDLAPLVQYSDEIYGLTATPSIYVNEALQWNNEYIYVLRPYDAIKNNQILPPSVNFIKTEAKCICAEALRDIIKHAKKVNPNIHHKILVTCSSVAELLQLRKEMEADGYKCFSSCADYGFGLDEEEPVKDYNNFNGDVITFIKAIDNYNGDCFVFHIRQLIQGIDIKSLTDCVIFDNRNGSVDGYRHTIQIIGRVLRLLDDDRDSNGKGKNIENRKKKFGGVYFITSDTNSNLEREVRSLLSRYYGIFELNPFHNKIEIAALGNNTKGNDDKIKGRKKTEKGIWDYADINKLKINIEQFIEHSLREYLKEAYEYKEEIRPAEVYANEFFKQKFNKTKDFDSLEFLTEQWVVEEATIAIRNFLKNLKNV